MAREKLVPSARWRVVIVTDAAIEQNTLTNSFAGIWRLLQSTSSKTLTHAEDSRGPEELGG